MGDHAPDKGYVRAHIATGEGAFDAGAYSFFGDMAPLDDGLGGALEDGLEGPPEELPAEEGALDDDEDLPIEDLLDTEEDEDLSLAALLRRRMQEEGDHSNGLSKDAAAAQQQHQHEQPLLPPLPPQPQMLSSLSQPHAHSLDAQPPQQQQQPQVHAEHAGAGVAAAAAPPPQLPDAAALDAVVPAPNSRLVAARLTPRNAMTAEELEARMLRSAEAPVSDARGSQLLSMLKGTATPEQQQQQQRQTSPLHAHDPAAAAQQQLHMGPGSTPMGPLQPHGMGSPMFGPGQRPPPHMLQQPGPGMMPPSHAGGPMPPPEVLAQMQQQQQQPPLLPGQQPPFMGPPPPHQPGMPLPPIPGPGMMGPGGPLPPFPGRSMHPGLAGPQMPPQSMPPPPQQHMPMGLPPHPGQPGGPPMGPHAPPGPYGFGPGGPPMGPGMLPGPGPLEAQQQQQRPGMMMPPPMRPGQELQQGPGQQMPLPGQLMQPGGMHPLAGGPPMPGQPQQQGRGTFKQQGLPPPGFPGLPAGMQQQQWHGSPGGPQGPPPHPQQQQQQQQQQQPPVGQPGGNQLPPWAGPGAMRPPMPPQQQQQGAAGSNAAFGNEYMAAATAAPADVVRVVSPAALVQKLRTHGSSWMAADDINYILRIQHMSTHSGVPYVEDFYFQAFCNKYFGGRNAVIFSPQQLRELCSELHLDLEPRFADLSGLGRVVLSNIRTPKMLMDVGGSSSSSKGGKAADTTGQDQQQEQEQGTVQDSRSRPLEQEPMLAARIMVEDCMLLLCDVEDIDRMFAASAAAAAAHSAGMQLGPHTPGPISTALAQSLLQRRAALLGGIAASFRLPDEPTLPPAADGEPAGGVVSGDGVFVRILALPKGRSLITKTLKLMFALPPTSGGSKGGVPANGSSRGASSGAGMGLDVIWALLRNAQLAFGPPLVGSVHEAERRLTDATIALSAITAEMVKRLQKPEDAVACLAAAMAGLSTTAGAARSQEASAAAANGTSSSCQLLPLFPAGRVPSTASPEWLGSILGSLLLRASELGLGSFAAAAAAAPVRTLGDGAPEEAEVLEQEAHANGVSPAAAAQWQALVEQLVQLVQLHLWQLVQAARGAVAEVAAAAGAGPGSAEVLKGCTPKVACVPLMRVLMAHCSEEQQEQLRTYLSEVGR